MEKSLYNNFNNNFNNNIKNNINNKMKNIIKNDINYLKSFQIGSGVGDIERIINSLIANKGNYDSLKTNIDMYIERLTKLNKLIIDENDNKGLLSTAEKLKPLSGDIENIFDSSKNFGKFIKDYKKFLEEKVLWNKDRLSLDAEATDQSDPTKYDIFYNKDKTKPFETQLNEFNEKLKIIYGPYMIDKTKSLKGNIIQNIDKIDVIIKISKEFNDYIQEKKITLDKILAISYDISNLKILNKMPENETEKISFEKIKLDPNSVLDMSALQKIESDIKTISGQIKIDEQIDKIKEINIFSAKITESISLEQLLDVDDAIELVKSAKSEVQIGGIIDGVVNKEYYTFDSNLSTSDLIKKIEILFELLDNIFNNFEYMKELQYRYNFYVHYLFLVISKSAENPNMETYQYISKNTAELYQKIFQNIKKSFSTINKDNKELIFLNKYHYLTVYKLSKLMDFIIQNLNGEQVVDVNNCKDETYIDLIVFNHFRQIILSLCKTVNGKTILNISDEDIAKL